MRDQIDQMEECTNGYVFWAHEYTMRNPSYLEALKQLEEEVVRTSKWEEFESEYLSWEDSLLYFDNDIEEEKICLDAAYKIGKDYPFGSQKKKMPPQSIIDEILSGEPLVCGISLRGISKAVFFENTNEVQLKFKENAAYIDVKILINSPLKSIIEEINDLIHKYRISENEKRTGIKINYRALFQRDKSIDALVDREYTKQRSKYRTASNAARAIGLWLWDYVNEHKCSQIKAIRAFADTGQLKDLRFENLEDSDLRFYFRCTHNCINAAEVLPFTK